MKYIFEDHENDKAPKLFRSGYPDSISNNFVYTRGHGNLAAEAERQLAIDDELVVVFIDMPPDNRETVISYNKVRRLCLMEPRLVLIPIVCSEYYIVAGIYHKFTYCVKDKQLAELCLSIEPWGQLPEGFSEQDKEYCVKFERLCKLALKKAFIPCISESGIFYTEYCICNENLEPCIKRNLATKSTAILLQYPAIPSGSKAHKYTHRMGIEKITRLCERLCIEYNSRAELFAKHDSGYMVHRIKPFRDSNDCDGHI